MADSERTPNDYTSYTIDLDTDEVIFEWEDGREVRVPLSKYMKFKGLTAAMLEIDIVALEAWEGDDDA